jgi:hypothetical protein
VGDERRERDDRRRGDAADHREQGAVLDRPEVHAFAERRPVAPREEVPRRDQRRQERHERHERESDDGHDRAEEEVERDEEGERPAPAAKRQERRASGLAGDRDVARFRAEHPVPQHEQERRRQQEQHRTGADGGRVGVHAVRPLQVEIGRDELDVVRCSEEQRNAE